MKWFFQLPDFTQNRFFMKYLKHQISKLFNIFRLFGCELPSVLLSKHYAELVESLQLIIAVVEVFCFLYIVCFMLSVLWRWRLGGRKGIQPVKNLGGCGGGGAVSLVKVAPTRTVGTSASIIFPCSIKIQKTGGGETQPECSTALC